MACRTPSSRAGEGLESRKAPASGGDNGASLLTLKMLLSRSRGAVAGAPRQPKRFPGPGVLDPQPSLLHLCRPRLEALLDSGALDQILQALLQPAAPPGASPPAPWRGKLPQACRRLRQLFAALRLRPGAPAKLHARILGLLRAPGDWRWPAAPPRGGSAGAGGGAGGAPAVAWLGGGVAEWFPAAARAAHAREVVAGCGAAALMLLPADCFALLSEAERSEVFGKIKVRVKSGEARA